MNKMTSIIIKAPNLSGLAEAKSPWSKFDWSPDIQHDIYRDWGTYYYRRGRVNTATAHYTEALKINSSDYIALFRRSKAFREAANIEKALDDARSASKIASIQRGPSAPINLQVCDALFDLNEFELSNCEFCDNIRLFTGVKTNVFKNRQLVVEDIIKDVTGRSMTLFFLNNLELVQHAHELYKASQIKDERPAWKILRDQKECDVLSIPEVKKGTFSKLEEARRARIFNIIHQTYMNDSWIDILFMNMIRKNPNLMLEQCNSSKRLLKIWSNQQYRLVRQFIKMLQCRSPLYYISFLKFPNKQLLEKSKGAYLFRIQHQTHRMMIADLKEIRKLRKEKRIQNLLDYIEKRMGDYYVRKTNRLMCWKFEFINEVYNTLALALCEQYDVPKHFRPLTTSVSDLLQMSKEKTKEPTQFVFGDRSTHQDSDAHDPVALKAKKLINRLEKRILFAKYSIEKCYLLHQIASTNLLQGRFDECCLYARRAAKETANCNSTIWKFLSCILIIKANNTQRKVEKTREALEEAIPVARKLKSPKLVKFVEACMLSNEEEQFKKMRSTQHSTRVSNTSSRITTWDIDS